MELSASTNIFFERIHEPWISVEETLRQCALAGFRKLDFGFAELALVSERFHGEQWKEEILEYQRLAGELGLEFVQAHATIYDFCNTKENHREKRALFEKSIIGAGMLGIPWIVVHPSTGILGGKKDPSTHQRNVEFFKEYAAFARAHGTGLAIENMWGKTREGLTPYCLDPRELLALVKEVDCENVKVCWDVEHGSIEKLDQREAIRLLGEQIVATHISDEKGIEQIHILPYLGGADWEEILGALAEINYRGIFNFEIQHYLPGMPKELVPSAMKFAYEVGCYMIRRLEELKKKN